jgi:hypothetical protein
LLVTAKKIPSEFVHECDVEGCIKTENNAVGAFHKFPVSDLAIVQTFLSSFPAFNVTDYRKKRIFTLIQKRTAGHFRMKCSPIQAQQLLFHGTIPFPGFFDVYHAPVNCLPIIRPEETSHVHADHPGNAVSSEHAETCPIDMLDGFAIMYDNRFGESLQKCGKTVLAFSHLFTCLRGPVDVAKRQSAFLPVFAVGRYYSKRK